MKTFNFFLILLTALFIFSCSREDDYVTSANATISDELYMNSNGKTTNPELIPFLDNKQYTFSNNYTSKSDFYWTEYNGKIEVYILMNDTTHKTKNSLVVKFDKNNSNIYSYDLQNSTNVKVDYTILQDSGFGTIAVDLAPKSGTISLNLNNNRISGEIKNMKLDLNFYVKFAYNQDNNDVAKSVLEGTSFRTYNATLSNIEKL